MSDTDKPQPGKIYAVTGAADDAALSNGNSWAESEVTAVTEVTKHTPLADLTRLAGNPLSKLNFAAALEIIRRNKEEPESFKAESEALRTKQMPEDS